MREHTARSGRRARMRVAHAVSTTTIDRRGRSSAERATRSRSSRFDGVEDTGREVDRIAERDADFLPDDIHSQGRHRTARQLLATANSRAATASIQSRGRETVKRPRTRRQSRRRSSTSDRTPVSNRAADRSGRRRPVRAPERPAAPATPARRQNRGRSRHDPAARRPRTSAAASDARSTKLKDIRASAATPAPSAVDFATAEGGDGRNIVERSSASGQPSRPAGRPRCPARRFRPRHRPMLTGPRTPWACPRRRRARRTPPCGGDDAGRRG